MSTVGFNHSGAKGRHDSQFQAFKAALAVAAPGTNIEDLWADDDPKTLEDNAKTHIAGSVDVLLAAGGSLSAKIAQALTAKISIVFSSAGDPPPVAANVTGVHAPTSQLDGKRLDLLNQLMSTPPGLIVGGLTTSLRTNVDGHWAQLVAAAPANVTLEKRVSIPPKPKHNQIDTLLDQAFANCVDAGAQAVLVTADPVFNNHRDTVVKDATVPAIYQWREFVDIGGLISYGPNLTVLYKLAGMYVGLLLTGKKTTDLPVLQLQQYELVINLTTAKKLGLFPIPTALLELADDIVV
jgi:putative tryptophan/tyrosine transport system substrate-binding protein